MFFTLFQTLWDRASLLQAELLSPGQLLSTRGFSWGSGPARPTPSKQSSCIPHSLLPSRISGACRKVWRIPQPPPRQGRITHSTQLPQLDRTQDLQHSTCTVRTTGPGTCLTDCKHHLMGTVLNLFWFAFQKCAFYLWITQ